ncbi:hypothetical protein UA08_05813 [Talaromyces atroroseus]|uniref:Uncharacterized protein n=1 Tax=Talaromyces atroroseus TaxID=1441469 RepID=A0A225ADB9_TALAT|nr:hypothetical protein UA08_05813 [Talaromyces atroroseus]OKL59162.1 hypothetical protein UA08_05813 [Talaromyces atroroseus]
MGQRGEDAPDENKTEDQYNAAQEHQEKPNVDQGEGEKGKVKAQFTEEPLPKGPWGDRGVTHRNAGLYKVPEKSSTLNVRINLDLRADVALELHAVVQGSVIIGLF